MDDKPDYRHPDYVAMLPKWQRCRDVIAGQDAVHGRGTTYLPMLTDQDGREYDAYRMRTPFYPATARTLAGLVGMIFRKDPHIDVPRVLDEYSEDITLSGVSLNGLARMIVEEVQQVGRCGVLVEFPRVEDRPATMADAAARNLRPYATLYRAESIINWRVERVNNRLHTTMVVLSEQHEQAGEFVTRTEPQIRVLRLVDGVYQVELFRKPDKATEWQMVEGYPSIPLRNGSPMSSIPFVWLGPEELTARVQEPPLLDLANVNLSHYRTSADLEHGAHFTGLPTPFIAGVQLGENEKIRIGSSIAIVSPSPQARAEFLEFSGQGLSALEKLLDRKEQQMAAIGARMLAPEKTGVEAEGTLQMRHSGESSVLASQARLISRGIVSVLEAIRDWAGVTGDVVYMLSTDFMPARMDAQQIAALVSAWQQGAISRQTLHYNLQIGEVIEQGVTVEEEEARIGDEPPMMARGAPGGVQDDQDEGS